MRLALGRLAIGLLALTAACAPATTPAPSGTTQTGGAQQPGGPKRAADQTLRVATGANPATLTPEGAATSITLASFQFDNLVNLDANYTPRPSAAEKWELLPDNSAWRFTLRKDLVFGNGEKATAEDVVNWIQVLLQPSPANTVGNQLLFVSGAKVVDDYTFDILLKQRDYSTPYMGVNIFVVSKKALEQAGGLKELSVNPKGAGTGPYEFVEYRQGDQIVYRLRSTPHPYRKPIATEIRYRIIPEPAQRVNGLRTGELDVALAVQSPELVEAAKRDGVKVDAKPDSYANIIFDQKNVANTPLADKRVRQAMNYAVNKEGIAQTLYRGYGVPIGQLGAPGAFNYNENVKPYPYDPAMAKRLLAEAGYPNGFKLQGLDFAQLENAALFQAVQSNHRDVGIEYEIVPNEFATYVQIALGQRPRKEMISAGGNNPNGIFTFSWQFLKCDRPPSLVIWCVPEMDRLLSLAYQEPDVAKRQQLLKDAAKAWADEVPMVFLIATASFVLTGPKVEGFSRDVPAYYTLDSVYRVE
ncbi:MAG: glutathione ABC transporter substrate-binding protein [Dehalococcoidia bacterium]|nr:MAG: glutathione ABC transporter substrate-binding protein [Dehalococcoidia bacterium]